MVEIDGNLPAPGPNGSSGSEGGAPGGVGTRANTSGAGSGVITQAALRRSVRALVSAFSMTLRPGRSELGEEGRGGEESIASRTLAPGCHARVVVRGREGKREGSPRAKRVNYLHNEQLLFSNYFKAHFLVTGHIDESSLVASHSGRATPLRPPPSATL